MVDPDAGCVYLTSLRLNIEFALQDGSSTNLNLSDVPGGIAFIQSHGIRALQWDLTNSDLYHGVNPELLTLWLDIVDFSKLLNSTCEKTKMDPMDYSESVFLRFQPLVDFAPLRHERPAAALDNLVHLTLCAIMTTLMPEYGRNQSRYDLLAERLLSALQCYATATARKDGLFLWALFVGLVTVLNYDDHDWVAVLAGELCSRLELHAWVDVHDILCQHGWICVLGDKLGMKLWVTVTGLPCAQLH